MIFFICRKYEVKDAVKYGFFIGSTIDCFVGIRQWYILPQVPIQGLHESTNGFGTMTAMTIPFTIYYILSEKKKMIKIIESLLLGLQGICIYLAQARGAMGALLFGGVLAVAISGFIFRQEIDFKRLGSKLLVGSSIILICAGMMYGIQARQVGEIARLQEGERLMMIESSYHMWEDHKLAGIGLDNGEKIIMEHIIQMQGEKRAWKWHIICPCIFLLQPEYWG